MAKIQQAIPRTALRRNQSSIHQLLASWFGSTLPRLLTISLLSLVALLGGYLYLQTTYTFSAIPTTGGTPAFPSNNMINNQNQKVRRGGIPVHGDDKKMDPRTLPELPVISVPPLDPVSRQPLNMTEFDRWANTPIVGSYLLHGKGGGDDNDGAVARIHMPWIDLQSFYHQEASLDSQSLDPSATVGRLFSSPDCAVLTRKGNKFSQTGVTSNQDRIATLDYVTTDSNVNEFWMGLFDGHGELGHAVSHFTLSEFQRRIELLRHESRSVEETKKALKKLFLAVNEKLPNIPGAGTTGISIWKQKDQLYVSNVGDSKAFVVSVDSTRKHVKVIYTTKPHKPDDPEERKRIEGMGGQIQEAPAPGYSARLLIPMGESPLDVMGLAMSRSLGDFDGQPYGLIAEPRTDAIALSSLDTRLDYLVILASDGLLDKVSEIEIAQEMAQSQLLSPAGKFLPLEAAEYLILKSSAAWSRDPFGQGYRDDISLAVHRLHIT